MKKILVCLSLLATPVVGAPKSVGYVSDFVGVLSADKTAIDRRISDYHKRTGIVVSVMTIQTLNGQNIGGYTHRLFHDRGIGNNGILILIVVNDRKARIEVGYGLSNKLSDSFCRGVVDKNMTPTFKRFKFGDGVNAALTTIFAKIGR